MTDAHSTVPTESLASDAAASDDNPALRWGSHLIGFAGLFTLAYGILFLYRTYFTDGFEAGVHALGGVTRPALAASHPEVVSYINHLHVNLAVLFVAVGVGLAALAWWGVRKGSRWAWTTALVMPIVFLVPSLAVHQTVAFSFHTLEHMGPAAIGGPAVVAGLLLAHRGLQESSAAEADR